MKTRNLAELYEECARNGISVIIGDDFVTKSTKGVCDLGDDEDKYIADMTTQSEDVVEVYESLYEEKSYVLEFLVHKRTGGLDIKTLQMLVIYIFEKCGYEPYVVIDRNKLIVDIVVTIQNFPYSFVKLYKEYGRCIGDHESDYSTYTDYVCGVMNESKDDDSFDCGKRDINQEVDPPDNGIGLDTNASNDHVTEITNEKGFDELLGSTDDETNMTVERFESIDNLLDDSDDDL